MKMKISIFLTLWVLILSVASSESQYSPILKGKLNGGYKVEFGHAKYLIFITRKDVYQFPGSLISEKHALTAAQNFQDFWLKPIVPYFGDYSVVIGNFNETIAGSKHAMEQIQAHRSYSPTDPKPSHDIAVITLMKATEKSEFVDWISLNTVDTNNVDDAAFLMGWGSCLKGHGLVNSNRQRKMKVRMMRKFYCAGGPNSNILCSNIGGSVNSVCKGDLGAPLVYKMNVMGILTKKLGNRLVYAGFTHEVLGSISLLQVKMGTISYSSNHDTKRGTRKIARWEQNYITGMATHSD